jgi:hypothetical protein
MFLEKSLLFSHFRYGWTWLLLHCKTILWLNMFLSCDPSPPWMINIFFTPGNWYVTLWIMDLAWYHIRRNFWRWRVRAVDRDGWKKGSAGWRRQNQRLSQTVDRGSRTAWQHWSDRLGWAAQRASDSHGLDDLLPPLGWRCEDCGWRESFGFGFEGAMIAAYVTFSF